MYKRTSRINWRQQPLCEREENERTDTIKELFRSLQTKKDKQLKKQSDRKKYGRKDP